MRHTNRLAGEKSPYLLQHATNPVDWYPWGEEAFDRARREDKPIFLSIGYSTCHWCHVMERESFEDGSVAELLNRDFVPIKVDREERPDVDRLYMTAAQAMGLGGGWPLNMFLTPRLEPFYGGTYFPPDTRWGRPGLKQVLHGVHEAWTQRRAEVEHTGGTVLAALDTLDDVESGGSQNHEALFADAARHFLQSFDREHGGFGPAPKFPSVVNLNFLLRWWARDPEAHADALAPVLRQLDAMRAGGIHDHVGGGFHRYSTDAHWLVPHFEKMLYDQAQLAWIYLEAFQVTGNDAYAATARDIFDYVARDLSSSEGGFDSAEDADSEGEEGRFYVWTPAELEAALGADDAALVAYHHGVTEHGNFEHGATILSEVHELDDTARQLHVAPEEAARRLERARARLLEVRSKRVRPHRDDKVITAWNGLMISAFARGARVLRDEALRARAVRAAEFAGAWAWDEGSGTLRRRWREGEAAGEGQLDDYAYLALGLLDLYQASHEARWLARAIRLTEVMVARFWDAGTAGFFESPPGDPSIRVRMKDGFDGAEMAGNSIAALNLITLGRLLDRHGWLEMAEKTLDYYARRLSVAPFAMPQMLVAMHAWRAASRHVVIAGSMNDSRTGALVAEYDKRFLPYDVLVVVDPGREDHAELAALVPFAASLPPKEGRPTAYVCVNYACRLPVTDPAAFAAQLEERPAMTATRSHP